MRHRCRAMFRISRRWVPFVRLLLLLLTLATAAAFPSVAGIASLSVQPPEPICFDEDEVTLVVAGWFPNGCWEVSDIQLISAGDSFQFQIRAVDHFVPGFNCTLAVIPYSSIEVVGFLPPGSYSVTATELVSSLRLSGDSRSLDFSVRNCDTQTFEAKPDGAHEVPPVETGTTGKLEVEIDGNQMRADFELEVSDGVAVTAAHLHCAPAGMNGPIIAFLFGEVPGGFDADGELAEFTLTNANITAVGANCVPTIGMAINSIADLAQGMRDGNIYVNVHTVANPPGEIRGQLLED